MAPGRQSIAAAPFLPSMVGRFTRVSYRQSPIQNCVIPAAARLRAETRDPEDWRPFSKAQLQILKMLPWFPDKPLRCASRLSGIMKFIGRFSRFPFSAWKIVGPHKIVGSSSLLYRAEKSRPGRAECAPEDRLRDQGGARRLAFDGVVVAPSPTRLLALLESTLSTSGREGRAISPP